MIRAVDYGFFISRVMHFYSVPFREVLKLPVVTFHMLNKNVDRLMAERDFKTAILAVKTQSGDGITSLMTDLKETIGTTVEYDRPPPSVTHKGEVLDRAGLHELKSLASMV